MWFVFFKVRGWVDGAESTLCNNMIELFIMLIIAMMETTMLPVIWMVVIVATMIDQNGILIARNVYVWILESKFHAYCKNMK